MARCIWTYEKELQIERQVNRIQFCMYLDNFNEDKGIEMLQEIKDGIMPGVKKILNKDDSELVYNSVVSRHRRLIKAKRIMGDYTVRIGIAISKLRELNNEIKKHSCENSSNNEPESDEPLYFFHPENS